jgi:PadR family transcriptional regulator, regulatory protein PadR
MSILKKKVTEPEDLPSPSAVDQEDLPRLSAIDQDVLTVLRRGRELYGLEILDSLNGGRPHPLRFSSLYPALDRAVDRELLVWRWGDDDDDDKSRGARRKYYKITAKGNRALSAVETYRDQLRNPLPAPAT